MSVFRRWQAVVGVALLLAGGSVRAIERTNLPVFATADRDGAPGSSRSLLRPGPWLLVVVHPDCVPCEAVLEAVGTIAPSLSASRVSILIADGTVGDLDAARVRYPTLERATWRVANGEAVRQALAMTSASALFGVRGDLLEWSIAGMLTDTRDLQTSAAAWLSTTP